MHVFLSVPDSSKKVLLKYKCEGKKVCRCLIHTLECKLSTLNDEQSQMVEHP